ncbi:hypothetical protein ACLB2K_019557 [Fragaria x ananassa]
MINGTAKGFVIPHQGLRQGDPISPYLFLLCAEGLSALISNSVDQGHWKGLQVCDGAPVISHLLFADDSMLYSQASSNDCQVIRNILNVYEAASGQQVYLQKSSVVFSGSVLLHLQCSFADVLGMQGVSRQIGDGQRTNIWYDPWLKGEELLQFRSPSFNKAKVPGKVKVCAWKAASNILPTRSRLSERAVDIDTQCPFCEEEVESPIHALRDCSHATECLQLAQVPLLSNTTLVYGWLVLALSVPTIFPILLIILWAIWRNRNQKVWERKVKHAFEIVPIALGWWEDYKMARSSLNEPRIVFRSRWKKPSVGSVKLNVDAAFIQILEGQG